MLASAAAAYTAGALAVVAGTLAAAAVGATIGAVTGAFVGGLTSAAFGGDFMKGADIGFWTGMTTGAAVGALSGLNTSLNLVAANQQAAADAAEIGLDTSRGVRVSDRNRFETDYDEIRKIHQGERYGPQPWTKPYPYDDLPLESPIIEPICDTVMKALGPAGWMGEIGCWII